MIAGTALVASTPVMLGAAVATLLSNGAPVLFRQERPGRNGKPFRLVKFRTMREAHGLGDAERLTRVGAVLRATSIDELPQLFNVLRGEMSLVGPRPLLMQYLARYSADQSRRHDVLPGITGWTQVNGRNALSWDEKFTLDLWYVDHWSLWLDLKILARTATRVLKRDGISNEGHATMPEFLGVEQ